MAEKEYIEREKAIDACFDGWNNQAHDCAENIRSIPAAEVRPVVLCKDCSHRDPEDHKCDCGQFERAGCVFPVDDDYFCAYGERRADDV